MSAMDIRGLYGAAPDFLRACADTPVMTRLKDVGMNCGCEYTSFPRFRGLARYSRWEHSLGVALITWRFTADRAQAVAALLHDVASPVFAHVVDFMRGDYLKQEATEAGTEAMIAGCAELQAQLSRCGLSTGDVSDYHRYPIADNDAPRLSADRLEYTLGNCVNFGVCSQAEVRRMFDDLVAGVNEEGQPELMFGDADVAGAFAEAALACSRIYVSDEDRYAMQMLAELLRRDRRRRPVWDGIGGHRKAPGRCPHRGAVAGADVVYRDGARRRAGAERPVAQDLRQEALHRPDGARPRPRQRPLPGLRQCPANLPGGRPGLLGLRKDRRERLKLSLLRDGGYGILCL